MLIEVLNDNLKVRPEQFGLSCTIMRIRMNIAYFSVTYWVIIDEDVVGFVINGFLKLTNCWKLSVLFPEKELETFLVQANHLGVFLILINWARSGENLSSVGEGGL